MGNAEARKRGTACWYDHGGSLIWVMLLLVVVGLVFVDPDARSVVRAYREGSRQYLAGQPLYNLESAMGYLYSPAFAVLYAPFYKVGSPLGDMLWRIAGFGVLTYAVVRQARLIDKERPLWLVSFALVLAAPLTAGAVRNGQATILLAGTCWLLIIAVFKRERLQILLWATIAIIAKPTAIVALLLSCALRPRFIPLLVLAVAILLALPYGFAPANYVSDLYRDFFALMTDMSLRRNVHFRPADFTAPFMALDIAIPPAVALAVRAAAALLSLAAVLWFAQRRKTQHGLVIFVIAAFYMCVFNPRVEGNTYALIAGPFALSIALMVRRAGVTKFTMTLGVILFTSGLTGVVPHIHRLTNFWFRPVISTILFAGIIWWFWSQARHIAEPRAIEANAGGKSFPSSSETPS